MLDGNPPQQAGGPGSAAPPNPSLEQMAGGQNPSGPDQSLQIIVGHLRDAKQSLQAAAELKPELSAVVDTFVSQVEPQVGQILFGAGQPAPKPQGLASLLQTGARALSTQP